MATAPALGLHDLDDILQNPKEIIVSIEKTIKSKSHLFLTEKNHRKLPYIPPKSHRFHSPSTVSAPQRHISGFPPRHVIHREDAFRARDLVFLLTVMTWDY
jgi:hypothetical protein